MEVQKQLTELEFNELQQCEQTIERGLKTFVEVGNALLKIRDKRLYRETHGTFEDYCNDRWSMDRRYAYRHIEAAEVVANIEMWSMDHKPENIRQTRPLTKLEPEVQREAWREVVEKHGENITAKKVEEEVKEWIPVNEEIKRSKNEPMFIADTPEEIIRKANQLKRQRKEERLKEKEQRRIEISDRARNISITHELIDLRHGDFIHVLSDIPDGSVDLILTDPPYPHEFIDCWSKLGAFAKRVLKPGGFCVAYSGKSHLPEVYERVGDYLDYYWTCNLIHTGNLSLEKGRNVITGWKPIILWQNGFSKVSETLKDTIIGTGTEKVHHQWQQAENELDIFIEYFTDPGDTIVEPFAGGGTTLVACAKKKRKVYGAEIDDISYGVCKKRIYDELR